MKLFNPTLRLFCLIFLANVSYGQVLYPGGDTCDTAVPIAPGLNYATPEDGAGEYDHWYSFTAPCDGDLTISHAGPNECDKRIYTGDCESLTLEAFASWSDSTVTHSMLAGESAFIQITDSWDMFTQFNVEFEGCAEIDSALLDIQGYIYYDLNNNGVKDLDEDGKYLNTIVSDPAGILGVTDTSGHYFSSVDALDDGDYQIYPNLPEYWSISSDSSEYNITVDDDFEQRDSMDFGLYPDTLIYEVDPNLIGSFPRCNDTIVYWVNYRNTGTTIVSGQIHLELDDSLHYVSAEVAPDSIVGQNIYWSYDDLYFGEYRYMTLMVGTPDGVEDTVFSTLNVTADSADVEMFSVAVSVEDVITCAYDPNDKTPTPLGEGEFGNIAPDTEEIEYLIRFQNTGTDTAFNVLITDQLDENLDWNSIEILGFSHDMDLGMTMEGEVSFIFNDILLPDSNVNMVGSQGYVKYKIDLLPDLPLGTSINNTAEIYFDFNPAIITNTTVNTLHLDESSITELMKDEPLLVYPNPFTETTTVYFGEELNNHSVQIVDLLGNQVYNNNALNGNQLEIEADDFKSGMYILILIDNDSNQVISNAKLIVK